MSAGEWRCGRPVAAEDEGGPEYRVQPELALAALPYLLSCFPARRSPAVAQAILDHLRLVEADARIAPCLRDCAGKLVDDWRGYAVLSGPDTIGINANKSH